MSGKTDQIKGRIKEAAGALSIGAGLSDHSCFFVPHRACAAELSLNQNTYNHEIVFWGLSNIGQQFISECAELVISEIGRKGDNHE